jgi:TPR repeat protein
MAWPLSQDYNEAIQNPWANFADPDLKRGEAVVNAIGIPLPCSGNFADVYQVRCPDGGRWAVKCFTRETPGLRERYQEISLHLHQAKLPFTVDFSYLEQGIRIRGQWIPVLKMQWVEGLTLNEFVRQSLDKPDTLEALLKVWVKMARMLREAKVGHCDLQHGNVLLVPGRTAHSLALKLIDYDGMWVPALAGRKTGEVGHPAYQHPQRLLDGSYSLHVDRFPVLLVAAVLRCLETGDKALWAQHDSGDNLLFRETDFQAPTRSVLFSQLLRSTDPLARDLVQHLLKSLRGDLASPPLLEEVIPPKEPTQPPAKPVTARPAQAEPSSPWFKDQGEVVRRPAARKGSRSLLRLAGVVLLVLAGAGGFAYWAASRESGTTDETDTQQPDVAQKQEATPTPPGRGDKRNKEVAKGNTKPEKPPKEAGPPARPVEEAARLFRLAREHQEGRGRPGNPQEAARCYRQAAEKGHPLAGGFLGVLTFTGRGVKKDEKQGRELCVKSSDRVRKAAQANDGAAQLLLGHMHRDGLGVEKDEREAAEWFQKAAEQSVAEAAFDLATMYATGRGVAKDLAEAIRWFQKAAEQGHAPARKDLERLRADVKKAEKAEEVRRLQERAEAGEAEAQFSLAWKYANGQDVRRNDGEAARLYLQAAKQGVTEAQYQLGVMYANGRGVKPDEEKAVRWYEKAARKEHASARKALEQIKEAQRMREVADREPIRLLREDAEKGKRKEQYHLAVAYRHGRGVDKDQKSERHWLREAAKQNHAEAAFDLATMYATGRGVARDLKEAARWCQRAAEHGHALARQDLERLRAEAGEADAQFSLAGKHANGQGVKKDDTKALGWYRKAADQGHAPAQASLARLYATGQGVKKDEKEAAEWYRKAADQGHAPAQASLGWMYANGQGVGKDEKRAVALFRQAATQNFAEGQYALGWMLANGFGTKKNNEEAARWYREAAKKGLDKAQHQLGLSYVYGRGVEKNEQEAVNTLRKAAQQDHAEAAYDLGALHANSKGAARNDKEAVRWYRKAAELKWAKAEHALGYMCEVGRGVVRDLDEARRWYQKAAARGLPEARERLGKLEKSPEKPPEKKIEKVTLQGELGCSTCVFKITRKRCGNAIRVEEDGKRVIYLIRDRARKEKYHPLICTRLRRGSVTGVVSREGDQRYIKPEKDGVKIEN